MGVPRNLVATTILTSVEGDQRQVQQLYKQFLHRSAETGGLTTWVTALQHGVRVEQVMAEILGSAEYQGRLQQSAAQADPSDPVVQDLQGDSVSLDAPGYVLTNVTVQAAPANVTPAGTFPWGLFSFTIPNVTPGGVVTVTITLPAGAQPVGYYKTDPTTGLLAPFPFNGTSGAEINTNVITLHLVDGGPGDSDGLADGTIVDPGGPLGTNGLPPDAVPLFNANEIVSTMPGAQGGNPMANGFSAVGPLNYYNGVVQLSIPELSSSGFGVPWGTTVNWTNGGAYASASNNGSGIVDTYLPTLIKGTNGTSFAVVSNGNNARFFDGTSSFTEHEFLLDTLTYNSTNHEYLFTDTAGDQIRFDDFTTGILAKQRGQLKSFTDPGGNVTSVVAHTSDGKVQEVQHSSTVGSTTVTESYLYTYLTSGTNSGCRRCRYPQLRRLRTLKLA